MTTAKKANLVQVDAEKALALSQLILSAANDYVQTLKVSVETNARLVRMLEARDSK